MGFSSQGGHLIVKTQADAGVLDPDLTTDGLAVLRRSGALATNRDLLVPDPEIGGGRDVQNAYLGSAAWSGEYETYPRINSLTTFIAAAFGTSAVVTATGVSTATVTPSDAAQLPFLSIEEYIGAGLECYNYYDAVVNTFHLEAAANGYLMGTFGMIAKHQAAGATPTDVTDLTDNGPLIVATNIAITYNSIALSAKNFTFDLDNQFEDSDFRIGSFYLGDLTPKRRNITASFDIRETSSALWRQATYGISSATAVGGLTTEQALVITADSYEHIPTTTTAYEAKLTIPNYILSPYSFASSGDDVIEDTVSGQALRPSLGTPIVTAVLKSDQTDIA